MRNNKKIAEAFEKIFRRSVRGSENSIIGLMLERPYFSKTPEVVHAHEKRAMALAINNHIFESCFKLYDESWHIYHEIYFRRRSRQRPRVFLNK